MSAVRVGALVLSVALVGCVGGGAQSDEVRAFCRRANEIDRYLDEGLDVGDVSDEDVIGGFEELADAAPDEIFDDVDLVREAYTYVVDTGDESAFEEPEVQRASARLAQYLEEECGIS